MNDTGHRKDRLLTPAEVASVFRVDPKTVTRWAAAGKLARVRTLGGHSRFRESDVRELLEAEGFTDIDDLLPTAPGKKPASGTGSPATPNPTPQPRLSAPVAPAAVPITADVRNNRGW